jgi:hypothetical protein
MSFIVLVGAALFGHSIAAFAVECRGIKDYRFWTAFIGYVMVIAGLGFNG